MFIVKNGNGDQVGEFEKLQDALDVVRNNVYDNMPDMTEEFDDYLNECYNQVEICGYKYDPSYVLYQIDNAVYNEVYNEYVYSEIDACLSDLEYEANRLGTGEFAKNTLTGYTITYIEDEELELEL